MDSFSPSSGSSTPVRSREMTEDYTVLNMTPRLPRCFKHPSVKLMEEIATLEEEITHLERYLLSLYRSTFQEQLPVPDNKQLRLIKSLPPRRSTDPSFDKGGTEICETKQRHQADARKDSSSVAAAASTREKEKKSLCARHTSLAHHLGNPTALVCPSRLSEDIIRCIASIYCKLANPTKTRNGNGHSVSSNSSHCSSGTFSPRNSWSPQLTDEADELSISECLARAKGPYSSMLEVSRLSLDKETYDYAAKMLQDFRSLVKNLEIVDPKKMSREEKLAFWINIHNALVMHGYLAYGTHTYTRSNSVMKASYNVGGICLNAYDIQSCILRIRPHTSTQWLQTLLSPGRKLKLCNSTHPYTIDYPEPLVHFALCSGLRSDPAVQVYSPKTIFDDLEVAKEEFIQSTVYLQSQSKLCLPKILRSYAKDMSLTTAGLVEAVSSSLSEAQQKAIRRVVKSGQHEKYVHWIGQASSFRYVIHRDLAR